MKAAKKKTPSDVTDFEREQLRFLLTREDLVATLVELNPSLAWLPALAEMKLLQQGTQLAPWIEKNFSDPDAIRDVAANIHFFNADTASILEYRLNHQENELPSYLTKSWRLIVRHMRTVTRGLLRNEWFELAPRIKRGECSPEVLERLTDVLRPKLEIGKRFSWRDSDRGPPDKPSDLMSIDYEIEDGVNEEEVLAVWPADASAETEEKLLLLLTGALSSALEDAIYAGVESNQGYGISDSDVPSVAKHGQNAHRNGFHPIARVIAEIWTRLASKEAGASLGFVAAWTVSSFRLVRRLALFAAANQVVPANQAADILISLPQGEFFLTNSSVEVFRLLRERWSEMPADKRARIEQKIVEGPPTDWFKEGSEIENAIDRSRYEYLGDMMRLNLELSEASKKTFEDVQARWPQWQLRPAEQSGFHVWHGRGGYIEGKADKLEDVADENLIDEAKKAADTADFMDGDAWQAFCQSNPQRALNGLEAKATKGEWPAWAWDPFLWATKSLEESVSLSRIAELLLQYPKDQFVEISSAASWWLNEKAKALDDKLLWPLWDKIELAATLVKDEGEEDEDA